ncbi:hypothetical protein C2S51_009277 [Perilla frutescens var. frutescens]|nr:hypothetical protein C2S51_009277 [Perilla frutescens var. frutescens]
MQGHVEVTVTEFEDGGIDDEMVDALAAEIDKEYGVQDLGQTEIEWMVVSDSEDEDFTTEEDSCDELINDIIFEKNIDKDAEWVGTTHEGASEDDFTSSDEDRLQTDNGSDFDSVDSDDVREESDGPSTSEKLTFSLGQMFSTK